MCELEGVCSECPLVEESGLEPSHVDSVSGVSVVTGEVELTDIVGHDDLFTGCDTDDAVLADDDVDKVLHLVVGEGGDGSDVCCVCGSGLDVCKDLLFGHLDPASVSGPGVVFSHLDTSMLS